MSRSPYTLNRKIVVQPVYTLDEMLMLRNTIFNMVYPNPILRRWSKIIHNEEKFNNILKIMWVRHYHEDWFKVWLKVMDIKSQDFAIPVRIIAGKLNMEASDINYIINRAPVYIDWILRTSNKVTNITISRKINPETNTVREFALCMLDGKPAEDLMKYVGNDADKTILSLSTNFCQYFDADYRKKVLNGKLGKISYETIVGKLRSMGLNPKEAHVEIVKKEVKIVDPKQEIYDEISFIEKRLVALRKLVEEL